MELISYISYYFDMITLVPRKLLMPHRYQLLICYSHLEAVDQSARR